MRRQEGSTGAGPRAWGPVGAVLDTARSSAESAEGGRVPATGDTGAITPALQVSTLSAGLLPGRHRTGV